MQKELELQSLSPIKQNYDFYQKLVEIREILSFSSADFIQLNQIHIEITTLRELLDLSEATPISQVIRLIQKETLENFPSIGIGFDSLLLKVLILQIMNGLDNQIELNDLRRLTGRKKNHSEEILVTTWYFLRKMQEELEIPSLFPIKQHYYFYLRLEEIRKTLDLSSANFSELNQFHIEIESFRQLHDIPETTPLSAIINLIRKEPLENFASLGLKYDSLLIKALLSPSIPKNQDSIKYRDHMSLKELDRVLFEVLKSYGPLSRPELVKLTGFARSSIFDSLHRLKTRGYLVQFKEKRSHTGRPTTVFDALI
jgi:hypothetical protein